MSVLIPWALCIVLAAALVVVLMRPLGKDETETAIAEPYDVAVTFVLYNYETFYSDCFGEGGYSDIGPGTQVTLTNAAGEILGVGSLGSGDPQRGSPEARCTYEATVNDVPAGEGFYSVEVASRGEITQSEAELKANGYRFEVSLGS